MLSDNIRNYRKENNMSQDELAEKLGVSRQSVSLWETGQTQPTIDNIIALTKIFNVSTDAILENTDNVPDALIDYNEKTPAETKKNKTRIILISVIAAAAIIGGVILFAFSKNKDSNNPDIDKSTTTESSSAFQSEEPTSDAVAEKGDSETVGTYTPGTNKVTSASVAPKEPQTAAPVTPQTTAQQAPGESNGFDLFQYCKDFAIKKGTLNGDYSIYQQPATRYGGYDNEYFSITYWGDSNMVELCLHCPLDDTYSINFYLRMRGGYNGKYEYLSSRYYRSDGVSLRSASGYIDPAVFSDKYPLSCDDYQGSADGQTEFMEESRVGICDLIHCLKEFVEVEDMECFFSDFGFVNY